MIVVREFAGRSVAVLGLGQSGMSAVRALAAGGADVRVWDDDARVRHAARAAGLAITDLVRSEWSEVDALIASPGIALNFPEPHAAVGGARAAKVPVIGDVELFARAQPKARIAGITGTNGKSTTTALLGHVLGAAGHRTEVGANLGTPILDLAPVEGKGIYILELSSYQLDLAPSIACEVAVLLNLSADHLDRHNGMAGYAESKKRIFAGQREGDTAIVGIDDSRCREIFDELRGVPGRRVVPVSVGNEVEDGIAAIDGVIYDRTAGGGGAVADLREARSLRGPHNMQNAACAYAAARALGLSVVEAAAALVEFPGLDHRMQEVASIGGVRFINDSKATNPEAAARALATHQNIYWIVGGRAKEGAGLDPLAPFFPRVRGAFVIGESAAQLAQELDGRVPITLADDLYAAVDLAYQAAIAAGGQDAVVLLSPACASFDQWPNFEARGGAFVTFVGELARRSVLDQGVGAAASGSGG